MTIATYSELVTEIGAFLNRADTNLTDRIPTFIALTEAKLNRLLDDPEMEVRSTTTATGAFSTLPTDFKRMISVSVGQQPPLSQISSAAFAGLPASSGIPRAYTIQDGSISFAPSNLTTPITILYVRRVPPLTAAAPTNWLLTLAPDIYLMGALLAAEFYGWNDERLGIIGAQYEEAIGELRIDGQNRRWGSAPLAPRIGRT